MILRTAGYVAFFLASFAFSLYLTFPWSAVKQRFLQQASNQLGTTITASALEPSWLTGVHAEGVQIELSGAEEPLALERVDARASVLSFLMGGYGAQVRTNLGGGLFSAAFSGSKTELDLEAEARDVELALVPALKATTGLALSGQLGLEADVVLGLEDPAKSTGRIELRATGLETLKGGKVESIPIPELVLGDLSWTLPIENGKVIIRNQRLDGRDVALELDGEVVLAKPIARSLVNLTVRFKPSVEFLQRERMLAALIRNIDRFKDREGYYGYQITGTIKRPRLTGKPS